jgi:putative hydrolase of the HAD superfamily
MKSKHKPKIKAIIFDLGGVVMSGGFLPFLRDYCFECLTPLGKKKIAELEHQVNLGNISEQQFYLDIQKIFHVQLSPHDMHRLIAKKMKVNKALLQFIPELKKEKVVMFTNSIGNMAVDVLRQRRVPTKKIFDQVFVSSKIHLAKPDRNAYRYVIKKLRVKPAEILLVDDRRVNVDQAKQLGMNGIIFSSLPQFRRALKRYDLV